MHHPSQDVHSSRLPKPRPFDPVRLYYLFKNLKDQCVDAVEETEEGTEIVKRLPDGSELHLDYEVKPQAHGRSEPSLALDLQIDGLAIWQLCLMWEGGVWSLFYLEGPVGGQGRCAPPDLSDDHHDSCRDLTADRAKFVAETMLHFMQNA